MIRPTIKVLVLALLAASALPASSARAEEPHYLLGGLGGFDVTDFDHTTAELRVEFAPGYRILDIASFFHGFGPLVGVMVNADGGVFGYGGIFADIRPLERFVVRPQFGVGAYDAGSGKDLGGVFQYHLGLEFAYQLDNGHRLGLLLAHISNNDVHEENPGENDALITYSVPLDQLF